MKSIYLQYFVNVAGQAGVSLQPAPSPERGKVQDSAAQILGSPGYETVYKYISFYKNQCRDFQKLSNDCSTVLYSTYKPFYTFKKIKNVLNSN